VYYDEKRHSMDTPARDAKEPHGYFKWEATGTDTVVHLGYDVVDRLLLEVMRGFGSDPRRTSEVGGVLLGSIDPDTKLVTIDDYDPLPRSHDARTFDLSEHEAEAFAAKIERAKPRAAGFYRSHTRDGLGLSAEDTKLYDRHFAGAGAVALLIKPYATRVSVAGFFIAEDGHIRRTESSYREFPFRRRELGGAPTSAAGATPEPTQEPLVFSDPIKKEPEIATVRLSSDKGVRSGWVWIPLSFIFLLMGVLLGFQAAITMGSRTANIKPESVGLSLGAERQGDSLHLRWDTSSPAIRGGMRGTLVITDGSSTRTLQLDANQLHAGSVIYRRVSEPVLFKMEVFVKDTLSVMESLEYRVGQPAK
jgi:hypothetical protein